MARLTSRSLRKTVAHHNCREPRRRTGHCSRRAALLVELVRRVQLDLLVRLDLQVLKAWRATLVLPALLARPAQRVTRVLQDQRGRRERRATLGHKGRQARSVRRVTLVRLALPGRKA